MGAILPLSAVQQLALASVVMPGFRLPPHTNLKYDSMEAVGFEAAGPLHHPWGLLSGLDESRLYLREFFLYLG